MSVGQCPGCGAPLEFGGGQSPIRVCEYCSTVIHRTGAKLENYGKVAELFDTQSPLKLGLVGRYSNAEFRVVGRLQKSHGKGVWDEWYLRFDDERTGWLSESEGEWNLMFELGEVALPPNVNPWPMAAMTLKDQRFVVEELGEAATYSASGELPSFDKEHAYIDLTGPQGSFATLDFGSTPPTLYAGTRVTLAALGFDANQLVPTPKKAALEAAKCPQCNGMLAMRAPDVSKRVTCPFCNALIDVAAGQLSFLQMLTPPPYPPALELGSRGTLEGHSWTVLAFLVRSCTVEGTRYAWDEYLLHHATEGFRWLMCSNGAWTFLTPIAAGRTVIGQTAARYGDKSFKFFQEVNTQTDHVMGECYWEVEVGETACAREFVAPPESLNIDETLYEGTVTHGKLLSPEEVRKAWGLKEPLPAPTGIAPAQPNPYRARATESFKWAAVWALGLWLTAALFGVTSTRGIYVDMEAAIQPLVSPGTPQAMTFTEKFEIPKDTPLEVELTATGLANNWLAVQVDLVNDATDEVVSVTPQASYYSGVEDGESWSEGSPSDTKQTAVVKAGTYIARATAAFDAGRAPPSYRLVVRAAPVGLGCPFFLMLLLFAWPIVLWMRANAFETARWNDSVTQPPTSLMDRKLPAAIAKAIGETS